MLKRPSLALRMCKGWKVSKLPPSNTILLNADDGALSGGVGAIVTEAVDEATFESNLGQLAYAVYLTVFANLYLNSWPQLGNYVRPRKSLPHLCKN